MISVSEAYKQAMSKPIRDRAYISVTVGIVDQKAQNTWIVKGSMQEPNYDYPYWVEGDIFDINPKTYEYATMEQNYFKCDGSMLLMSREAIMISPVITPLGYPKVPTLRNGVASKDILGTIDLGDYYYNGKYEIKGLTIDFGSAYPTEFEVITDTDTFTYTNDKSVFMTNDYIGETSKITIKPISMVGGQQRLRIHSILLGVGLSYTNAQAKDFGLSQYGSSISEELPSEELKFTFYDEQNQFNVDDDNSFLDFLETMQNVTVAFGMTLDNGEVEWHQIANEYLKDWESKKGLVYLTATDRLSQMEEEYTLANRIYERTAYEEAESIFVDAGLQPDEYYIDEYLQDIALTNPMPEGSHKECLQILANACRCIIKQDEYGKIMIVANFANVLDPDDLILSTNGVTEWSKPNNILVGTNVVYADMTRDFLKADGSMYFLPKDASYLDVGYVSEQISDGSGFFEQNPTITIETPASYTYHGINMEFGGNAPKEMIVHTYNNDELIDSTEFTELKTNSTLMHEFSSFNKIVFEFTKGYPNNRVVVNKISFGSTSDYLLTRRDMMSEPIGYKERKTKSVRCKIYSYTTDENGKPVEVEDNVYYTKEIGTTGEIKTIQNPLISTEEHAELLAEWIGNYYANNVSYDVDYRGEPRITASDIIHMESDKLNNLQVEITKHDLKFNGAFSGSLELRRALKMIGDV